MRRIVELKKYNKHNIFIVRVRDICTELKLMIIYILTKDL